MISKYISDAKAGVFSFIIVLLFMPIGHSLMILNEKIFLGDKLLTAFGIGILGVCILILGLFQNKHTPFATLLGLLAAILVWTGWVEFSFVWIAEKLAISPLIENGEVTTKPEYLVMMSSLGILCSVLLFFMFNQTRCQFFVWFQRLFGMEKYIKINPTLSKPVAMTTFIETIMILWTFYIVLLLLYDKDIIGDRHPITYIAAFATLTWSIYLFFKLISIKKFDYAIRYAVPTVIIFWNFIEIMGRWDLFKEIWVHPFEHWIENTLILSLLCIFLGYYLVKNKQTR